MSELRQAPPEQPGPAGEVRLTPGGGGQVVVQGHVLAAGSPLPIGYVRLLDATGEFVAEVPLAADGAFTFYTVPGSWTVRLLAPGGLRVDRTVPAQSGMITELDLIV